MPVRAPAAVVVAVALCSLSVLAGEVTLSRTFSVLFRAPYVFLIVSGAIGGLGLGGLLAQCWPDSPGALSRQLPLWLAALALSIGLPVPLLFGTPLGRELVGSAETLVVVAVPLVGFTVAGMLLSIVFRTYRGEVGRLYAADLGAAALGAPLAVAVLNLAGAINATMLMSGLTALVAAALAARERRLAAAVPAGLIALGFLGLAAVNRSGQVIDLPRLRIPPAALSNPGHLWHATTKPLFAELADPYTSSKVVRTDWSAVSRTDVVHDPSQSLYYVYTDGDVPTQMEPWDGDLARSARRYSHFIGMLPFRLLGRSPESVMAIGAGGGLDVLLALGFGARRVDAVEINPSLPGIVRDPRFQHTYARLYADPRVRLTVDEGRSFLQRAGRYDVIYFACAKTATTQTSGVALLDNHLYTVEAFHDYWTHLTDQGLLALVTQEGHLLDRLVLTAVVSLRRQGLAAEDAAARILTARVPPADFRLGPYRHLLVLSKRDLRGVTPAQLSSALSVNGLQPLLVPGVSSQGAGGAKLDLTAATAEFQRAIEAQYPVPVDPARPDGPTVPAGLSVVTDDRPFYVDVSRGLHPSLRQILLGALAATLLTAVAVTGWGCRVVRPSTGREALPVIGGALYFTCLGAGFMLAEVVILQKLLLLLGFPTRSLTITLCVLLLSCAAGSRSIQRAGESGLKSVLRSRLLVLAALLVVYGPLVAWVSNLLLAWPLWGRAAGAVVLLAPVGLLLGQAFPGGLRLLPERAGPLVPLFWAANGAASILGSVLAMVVAKYWGYNGSLLCGAGCYLAAALLVGALRPSDQPATAGPELEGDHA